MLNRKTTWIKRPAAIPLPTIATVPLSPMQQGMLFNSLYQPHVGVDIEQVTITSAQPIDADRLIQAWQQIIQRHPILGSTIVAATSPQPQLRLPQWPTPEVIPISLTTHNWVTIAPAQQTTQLESLRLNDRQQGFDLLDPTTALMRLHLIQLSATRSQLIWIFHHLLLDGRSITQVLQEVFAIYDALSQGKTLTFPPAGQYADYIQWQQQQDFRHSQPFWQDLLAGFSGATPLLPPQASADLADTPGHQTVTIALTPAETTALIQLAQLHNITPNTVVQGLWGLLLSRYSGKSDVVFGTVRAGRQLPIAQAKSIVGMLINTIPVRVQIDPGQELIAYLQDLRSQHLAVRPHEHTPLMQIQAWSEVAGGTPLFESLVMFENHQRLDDRQQQSECWQHRTIALDEQPSFPLVLIAGLCQQLELKISADRTRFDHATIARISGHFQTLCHSAIANPHQTLGNLPWLTTAETDQLLVQWNQTSRDYDRDRLIHELFEAQVIQQPDAIALVYDAQQLTYYELNQRSNQLAHFLVQQGLQSGEAVGIYLDRGFELIIALMAVVKAGGAYVPFEPSWPDGRVQQIADSLDLRYMITGENYRETLTALRDELPQLMPLITLGQADRAAATNLDRRTTAQNPAYIIFTSGSTGVPKGVVVHHQSVINLIEWVNRKFQITPADRGLFITSVCFDLSVYDIFGLLAAGASLQIASNAQTQDPHALLRLIQTTPITFWNSAPPTLQQLVPLLKRRQAKRRESATEFHRSTQSTDRRWADRRQITAPPTDRLRLVFLSGDWVPTALPGFLQTQFPQVQVIALGGATEATVWSNFYDCDRVDSHWHSIPYGKPIQNAQYYILDPQLQPCPVGVTGELYIGGECLAQGYTDAAKTAAQFIPDPRDATATLYRTGDLARFFPDGNIEFLGRIDHQVKIRGFRIELGEIESVLMRHPLIETAIVLAQPLNDQTSTERQDYSLVAYVIPKPIGANLTALLTHELPTFLREYLPTYMLPSAIVEIAQIPLTANGKLDRTALLQQHQAHQQTHQSTTPHRPPSNALEQELVTIWETLLQRSPIGCRDNFFDLGGHSLLAVELVAQIDAICDQPLSLAAVFRAPTIAQMAQLLNSDRGASQTGLLIPVRPIPSAKPPLFWCQFCDEIAAQLPIDQPIYGIDSGGMDIRQPADHIVRWATDYIAQIQAIQPTGPYYLGGYCFGGYLALEIAQQLRQQGETVELVILLESYGPAIPFYQSTPTIGTIALNLLSLHRRLQEKLRLRRHANANATNNATTGTYQQHIAIPRAPIQAAVQSYPLRAYAGDVLMIYGNASHLGSRWLPQLGWGQTFTGKAELRSVAGGHLTLLEAPYIQPVGTIITAALAHHAQP